MEAQLLDAKVAHMEAVVEWETKLSAARTASNSNLLQAIAEHDTTMTVAIAAQEDQQVARHP